MKANLLRLAVVCLLFMFVSCSKSGSSSSQTPPPTGGANPSVIDISGMAFPATTTVPKGTKVTWNNKDPYAHTVTSDDNTSFNSGTLNAGASFSYVANTAGTFTYHCNIHSNMHGSLVVTQ